MRDDGHEHIHVSLCLGPQSLSLIPGEKDGKRI
jgi:hypothetical protein